MCEDTHSHQHSGSRILVEPQQNLLSTNDHLAGHIRKRLDSLGIRGLNLMGSPGSGKTALLEALIDQYPGGNLTELAVLEGDLATNRDAERILAKGVRAQQITTGSACHLSASLVAEALIGVSLEGLKSSSLKMSATWCARASLPWVPTSMRLPCLFPKGTTNLLSIQ